MEREEFIEPYLKDEIVLEGEHSQSQSEELHQESLEFVPIVEQEKIEEQMKKIYLELQTLRLEWRRLRIQIQKEKAHLRLYSKMKNVHNGIHLVIQECEKSIKMFEE